MKEINKNKVDSSRYIGTGVIIIIMVLCIWGMVEYLIRIPSSYDYIRNEIIRFCKYDSNYKEAFLTVYNFNNEEQLTENDNITSKIIDTYIGKKTNFDKVENSKKNYLIGDFRKSIEKLLPAIAYNNEQDKIMKSQEELDKYNEVLRLKDAYKKYKEERFKQRMYPEE